MFKIAIAPKTKMTPALRGAAHADDIAAGQPRWAAFERELKSKQFRSAVVNHPKSDEKLRRYTENVGNYLASKKVFARVPSRTSNKTYTVKELPDGRLGCGCKDWQYKHSHSGGDCQHIAEVRDLKKAASALGTILGGGLASHRLNRMAAKGKKAKQTVQAVHEHLGW